MVRTEPGKSVKDALLKLQDMHNSPSLIVKHFLGHPKFTGDDIGMSEMVEESKPKQGRHSIASAHAMLTKRPP